MMRRRARSTPERSAKRADTCVVPRRLTRSPLDGDRIVTRGAFASKFAFGEPEALPITSAWKAGG